MPALLQASISKVPAGAVTFLPSTVMFTSAIKSSLVVRRWPKIVSVGGVNQRPTTGFLRQHRLRRFLKRARLAVQMILKLLPKLLDERHGRHGRGITQRAERPAQHVFRQVVHVVDIFFHAAARVKANQCLFQPVRTFAAGDAPAATLVLVKLHGPQSKLEYAGSLVEDDHAAAT